jgi:hypothetical protein
MFNTFKTIKNHNDVIRLAKGEELLSIPFTDREKGLIETLDIKPYPHKPSIERIGDYILTMLHNEYYHEAIQIMGDNEIGPIELSYFVSENPKWSKQERCDNYFWIDITKDYYKQWA